MILQCWSLSRAQPRPRRGTICTGTCITQSSPAGLRFAPRWQPHRTLPSEAPYGNLHYTEHQITRATDNARWSSSITTAAFCACASVLYTVCIRPGWPGRHLNTPTRTDAWRGILRIASRASEPYDKRPRSAAMCQTHVTFTPRTTHVARTLSQCRPFMSEPKPIPNRSNDLTQRSGALWYAQRRIL